MNAIILTGKVVAISENKFSKSGSPKVEFTVEMETKNSPVRWNCIANGALSESLPNLSEEDYVLVSGRVEANLFAGSKSLTIILRDAQRLEVNLPDTECGTFSQ